MTDLLDREPPLCDLCDSGVAVVKVARRNPKGDLDVDLTEATQ